MPKHRANLDFLIEDDVVSSRYDLDGELAVQIDVDRPERIWIPVRMQATNYCRFRGMLMKSAIHFRARAGVSLRDRDAARLTLGDHPRIAPLRRLEIRNEPLFTAFLPDSGGVLDDHVESWFLTSEEPVDEKAGEGLESVVDLGLGEEWPPPPNR